MNYQYSYLIGCLSLLFIWSILYFFRKDTKKEILITSILFGIAGLFVDPIYSSDWWNPLTITNTLSGIESFIFGFSVAGIASVIYEETFYKKLNVKKDIKKINPKLLIISLFLAGLFFGCYFILKWNSFYSSFPAFLIPVIFIWIKRKDLIVDSVFSGFLLMIISFVFYFIPELITPGWIESTWNYKMISGLTILKVPIEDLIWFFIAGLLIGPLYEYWQEGRLINIKKHDKVKKRK
jgi:hypothetical protein